MITVTVTYLRQNVFSLVRVIIIDARALINPKFRYSEFSEFDLTSDHSLE